MTTYMSQPRRKKSLRRRTIEGVAVLAALFGLLILARMLLTPWDFPLPGKPQLTGYWQGEVSYTADDKRRLMLHLVRDENCSMACDVTGEVKICGAEKDTSGDFAGDVHNWRGSRFSLNLYLPTRKADINMRKLDGEWEGDVVRMRSKVDVIDADGAWSSNRQIPDPPMFEMRRASETVFEAAC
ncbi:MULTISPECIES: hypothetical protein [unclassified Streptomyces]|uniref:hypothetical protein n=1 Tax=unclassified Streptomyces TaxID=2593676 RepID=UPI00081E693D|nr:MULTISPECIES: hypothetical protein [unclassified Streptomyces]MYZ36786.1 hypothetical protein [Streptomyces sp. SID4917]SCF86286.1 hypothetical protein GA0115259_103805 [Streptomyces sp. MnatMP-M17]